jgi:hypothetical protein
MVEYSTIDAGFWRWKTGNFFKVMMHRRGRGRRGGRCPGLGLSKLTEIAG